MVARVALLALVLFLGARPAEAAPVQTNILLGVEIHGLGTISFSSAAIVSVTGSTVSVAPGWAALPATIVVPVTSTTALSSITAMTISNQAGTFSIGGVTAQAPGEVCAGAPAVGVACNAGGGIGGVMGLNGTIFVHLPIPGFLNAIPIDLNSALIGQGGTGTLPFDVDAALWSTGVGSIGTALGTLSSVGAGAPLSLVTPTYVNALGTELPIFATLTFTNVSLPVPEPGLSAVLLGALGLGWVLLARR